MVIFMHIHYNNSCTRVFRMCLMVIDMCIDKTLGILGQLTPTTPNFQIEGHPRFALLVPVP